MRTVTDKTLSKLAKVYFDSLDHVLYEFNGEEKETEFTFKKIDGNIVHICILFEESILGKIGNIRAIDKDGDVAAVDPKTYRKTSEKMLYISFKHEFVEV